MTLGKAAKRSRLTADESSPSIQLSLFLMEVAIGFRSHGGTPKSSNFIGFCIIKRPFGEIILGNFQMGLSENSVPLNPMVNDHYPY